MAEAFRAAASLTAVSWQFVPRRGVLQYALIDGVRQEAAPKLVGECETCKATVIAKCGTRRIWHWAHQGRPDCDPWRETETLWHRQWKGLFPSDWREVRGVAPNGECHVADVKTDHGLVLEFQRSHITPDERISREVFYRNMVWVVDGTRLLGDWPRFEKGYTARRQIIKPGFFITPFPALCFGEAWANCRVPVFFDFAGTMPIAQLPDARRHPLYCMLPGRVRGYAMVFAHSRSDFVDQALHNRQVVSTEEIEQGVANFLRNELIA